MHVFLSHNHRDNELAVPLAAQLRLVGADVWLDDWEIKPGDSIPGKVNDALAAVDTVLILWSANAATSRWVEAELATALDRRLSREDGLRVVPIRLDDAPLPALLRPLKWLRMEDSGDVVRVAPQLAGIDSQADFIRAIQQTIDEAGLEFAYFEGYGLLVGCPRCGAPVSELQGLSQEDERRGDMYAGARCTKCGWNDGGEI